jgi:hypothetical protein
MITLRRSLWLFTVIVSTGLCHAAAVTLAEKGQLSFPIVISTNAIPSERHAAEELQAYVQKISGVTLPIVTDAAPLRSREIILGDNAHLHRVEIDIDPAALGAEEFILRSDHGRLVIAGGKPRGTLYGVYELLEQKLGVRWFTPELEVIPHTNKIVLPALNERHAPALEYREDYWTEAMRDTDFAARHRLNGANYKLKDMHGGRGAVYHPFVHSMDLLVPPELYAQHPEYFPLINGKRVSGYVQRCLSNPDVLKIAIANVRKWIKEHPKANIISVSQNDTFNYCQCDQCKALDEAEGSPSASLLKFVNAVAEDIEKDYPQVRIDTLAYQYTRKPPKTIRPRPNVIVRLCSIECCFAHPLETCVSEENRRFREDILAWEPVAPKLYVWDYVTDFSRYQQPFPNLDVLQPNIRFFAQHNVRGIFEEGNYSGGGNGELAPLKSYLLAELLWNPEADVHKLMREFINAYYGHAAPKVFAYVQLLEEQVRDPKIHAHIGDPTKARYLNEPFAKAADALLADAEKLAENDTVRLRVQTTRLPVWYVLLYINHLSAAERTALISRFIEVAHKSGISNISEGRSFEDWANALK